MNHFLTYSLTQGDTQVPRRRAYLLVDIVLRELNATELISVAY